jgi:hypothetical protein
MEGAFNFNMNFDDLSVNLNIDGRQGTLSKKGDEYRIYVNSDKDNISGAVGFTLNQDKRKTVLEQNSPSRILADKDLTDFYAEAEKSMNKINADLNKLTEEQQEIALLLLFDMYQERFS